jgi:hypothetical protein
MPSSIVQTCDQFPVCPLIDRKSFQPRALYIELLDFRCRPGRWLSPGNRNLEVLRLHLRPEFTMRIGLSQDIPNHSDCAVKHLLFILVAHGFSSVAS